MSHVLAYQTAGTDKLECIKIPKGFESTIDAIISQKKGITISKLGIDLTHDEIVGLYTEQEYQNLKVMASKEAPILKPSGPGHQSFLELGAALKRKQSLDKWKKYDR